MSRDSDHSAPAVRRSYIIATMIFLILAAWIISGQMNNLGFGKPQHGTATAPQPTQVAATTGGTAAPPPAQGAAPPPGKPAAAADPNAPQIPTVRVRTITAE